MSSASPSSFNSLTFSLLKKLLDRGVPVNISVPEGKLVRGQSVEGEIQRADWWETEKIVNIQYRLRDEANGWRIRDFRVRPLNGHFFDEMYIIKKIDGIFTLMPRKKFEEQVDEAQSSENAESHIFASMFKKLIPLVDEGRVFYQAGKVDYPQQIAKVVIVPTRDAIFEVHVHHESGEIWVATIPPSIFDRMSIRKMGKDHNGKDRWLVALDDELDEAVDHSTPLLVSQLQKLLNRGERVYVWWGSRSGETYPAEIMYGEMKADGNLHLAIMRPGVHDSIDDTLILNMESEWTIRKDKGEWWLI